MPRPSVGRGWIGRHAAKPQTQVFTRALGARDLALGLGAVNALRSGQGGRSWFAAHAIVDGTDLVATIAARDKLPASGYRFAMAMAGASTLIALAATAMLPSGGRGSP